MTHKKYFPYLCRFLGYLDGTRYDPKVQGPFPASRLLQIQPHEVLKWLTLCTYGKEEIGPDDRPTKWRVDSIEFAKKAVSFYMPHHGEWNNSTSHGNPTRDKSILKFIQDVKKFQVRRQGRASQVKRDMTLREFKKAIAILEAGSSRNIRWTTCLKLQFHLIGRGDDAHEMETKNIRRHPHFDFALQTQLNWSKNVNDERDCPPQFMLGSMNPTFCVLLDLAIYLELKFSRDGSLHSKYLFTDDVDDEAPKQSFAAYSRAVKKQVFENASFVLLSRLTAGGLGIHSIRKIAPSWIKMLGGTQDEIETRGRWKRATGGRVSSRYINPDQQCADAKVCGMLCIDGPVKYEFEQGAAVGRAFFVEFVCPAINRYFPETSMMADVLGPALLWACYEPSMQYRIPEWLRTRVRDGYASCRPPEYPEDVNPIKKTLLVIFRVGDQTCIEPIAPAGGDPGNDNDNAAAAAAAAGGVNNNPVARQQNRIAEQYGRQEFGNQITAQLHNIQVRLTMLEEKVEALAGDMKQEFLRQISMVNRNVNRLQVFAPRQRGGGDNRNVEQQEQQHDGGGHPVQTTNARLSARPKDLHSLWTEYTHGLGGLKAARDFTPAERGKEKRKYSKRKVFWDVIAKLVDGGWTASAAVDRVYTVYGRHVSVTTILVAMLRDRKHYCGLPNPGLRVIPLRRQ